MKHVLSFEAPEEFGGTFVNGADTRKFLTKKLDRPFTIESLVVLSSDFFLLSLELEGYPFAHFACVLVGEGALGRPLPMPAFVVKPSQQAALTVMNNCAARRAFGAYFFGDLEGVPEEGR